MEDIQQQEINLEPFNKFFTEEIYPKELAGLLDEFLFEYIDMLIHLLYAEHDSVHLQTHQFIYYLRTLRDILPECEKV